MIKSASFPNVQSFSDSVYKKTHIIWDKYLQSLWNTMGYRYIRLYLYKDRKPVTARMTATYGTMLGLKGIENFGHILYTNNFSSYCNLFDSLLNNIINCWQTVTSKKEA